MTKLRITHLATSHTNFKLIGEFIKFQKSVDCQFTIKELVGYCDNGIYKKIKEKYNKFYFIDDEDYNIYYMPNNSTYFKFRF